MDWVNSTPPGRDRPEEGGGRGAVPAHRHHVRGLRRRRQHRAADPVRHDAARLHRARVAQARARRQAARAGAERVPVRRLSPRARSCAPASCPADLVYRNDAYEPAVVGIDPPANVYSHIVGIDLVRTGPDEFFVLEDNCRTPSGVSYMLENREIMMRMFPELFRSTRIAPVDDYPDRLRRTLGSVAPTKCDGEPVVVLLTPGRLQQRLLRAFLPRRPDGDRTRRGAGSVRAGRVRLHAHDRGAEAGRRDLSPDRRRLPRPAVLPARLDARRAGPDERLSLGRRLDLPRRRARASPTTRRSTPSCRR